MKIFTKKFFFIIFILLSFRAYAACERVTSTGSLTRNLISLGYTARSWSGACDTCNGNIGLPSVISISSNSEFLPSGTLLASSTASFVDAAANNYTQNQILFRCQLRDADRIYEMYATNGDSEYAGQYITNEVEDAYYSVAKNVAYRLTNTSTGEHYSRYWKQRKLSSEDWVQEGNYIYIPVSAFSGVTIELFKINSTSHFYSQSKRWRHNHTQLNGYIAFKAPGISNNVRPGSDSASHYEGAADWWPGAYGMYGDVTFVRGASCIVKDFPSVVVIPKIGVSALASGGASKSNFSVTLHCEDSAVSSDRPSTDSSANVAMGFMVNKSSAVTTAQNLGLTSGTGLTYLLDAFYGSPGVASGVGIRIYDSNDNVLNLLSNGKMGTGSQGGWYGYKELTQLQGSSTDESSLFTGNFTASLQAIPGETVTVGSVNAELQVVVSFQ